jgi:SAM-dependent methyltransferase
MYHFAWARFGKPSIEHAWEKDSDRFASLIPRAFTSGTGRVGLDAGCGAGLDLVTMARGGADIIGIDVSTGVDVARELLRDQPNAHLVQGDLNAPPFREDTFDFIYSFGVLHHLADTQAGFSTLARLLKPGAPLITYLYERFDERSQLERSALSVVSAVRRATVRLPPGALYALCWLAVPVIWLTCALPAHMLREIAPRIAIRIPFRHTVRWTVLASDLFDRFSPPVERRYTSDEVKALYASAGLCDPEVHQYRGWVSWAFAPPRADADAPLSRRRTTRYSGGP